MNKEKKVGRIFLLLAYCVKEKVDTCKRAFCKQRTNQWVLKLQPRTKLFTRLHLHLTFSKQKKSKPYQSPFEGFF